MVSVSVGGESAVDYSGTELGLPCEERGLRSLAAIILPESNEPVKKYFCWLRFVRPAQVGGSKGTREMIVREGDRRDIVRAWVEKLVGWPGC
jgi:hypothetical protein